MAPLNAEIDIYIFIQILFYILGATVYSTPTAKNY